jgi:hypothetical protein
MNFEWRAGMLFHIHQMINDAAIHHGVLGLKQKAVTVPNCGSTKPSEQAIKASLRNLPASYHFSL